MEVKIIGRASSCDFVVKDEFVSREHLQIIKYSETDFRIIDIDSTTGTYVNGQKIKPEIEISVEKTDIIKIGNTLLKWNEFFKKESQMPVNDIYATKPDDDKPGNAENNNRTTFPEELYQMVKAFAEDGIYSETEKVTLKGYCTSHNIDYENTILPLMNSAIDEINLSNKQKEQHQSTNKQIITNVEKEPSSVIFATFGQRLGAFVIDAIIVGILDFSAILVIVLTTGIATSDDEVALNNAILLVINWFYFALFESSKAQATLGKQAIGIKVTNENENRISFAKASGRFFGRIVSTVILLIGYLMPLWTEKKQALHDIISGCLVVRK